MLLLHFEDNASPLIIANPAAGRRRRLATALAAWPGPGTPVVVETSGPGDASRLSAAAAARGVRTILAAGGDGTVNEIVNGLVGAGSVDRRPAVGVLPLGTANVLARELGIPLDPAAALRSLASAHARPAHLGVVNGRYFVMMAGVGFDAHVVAAVRTDLKRRFGRFAYALTTADLWIRGREHRYRLHIDGRSFEAGSVVVGNGRHYAGGFVACPGAGLAMASFEFCILPSAGRGHLLATALSLGVGRIAWAPGVRHVTADYLHVSGPAGDPVQADGEIVSHLPATFSIAPDTIDLLTPAPFGGAVAA